LTVVASIGLLHSVLFSGCSSNPSTSAQFTASMTAPAPGLVKLVQRSRSGSRVVVDVVIYGPDPALDLFAFRFGVKVDDSALVKFAPQPDYSQNALAADAGQAIAIDVDGTTDPSTVQVVIGKQGGGAGNGIGASSAIVIELPFDVLGSGATTLTLIGLGADQPEAIDSTHAPIAAVRFDAASAGLRGVTTGGSGY
jgi:hypothetical protein